MKLSIRGEIATSLTLVALLLLTVGVFVGRQIKQTNLLSAQAANSCAYEFNQPILTQTDGSLICTVNTTNNNIPTISCSIAQDGQWAADSKLVNASGTALQYELTLFDGYGSGTYDLIAYEFDQHCSHPDQSVQVFVNTNTIQPTATPTIPPPTEAPTPTTVPACVSQGKGVCQSEALCRTGATNEILGDLDCSQLKPNWVCCAEDKSIQPTINNLQPTTTPVLSETPTQQIIPTTDPPTTEHQDTITVRSESCSSPLMIAGNNRQSWVYRESENNILEVVPLVGPNFKQQFVEGICNE
jgi:hypothetical protein